MIITVEKFRPYSPGDDGVIFQASVDSDFQKSSWRCRLRRKPRAGKYPIVMWQLHRGQDSFGEDAWVTTATMSEEVHEKYLECVRHFHYDGTVKEAPYPPEAL